MKQALASASFALLLLFDTAALPGGAAAASEIKYVVNGVPVTSYDIQRRAAFLKLQRRKGNLSKLAGDEMVEQTLRNLEVKRLNINITDQAVDDAYGRFAKSNKMTLKQLDGIMEQTGVTKGHFKEFIRAQMGWSQAVSARFSAKSKQDTKRDAVQRMFRDGTKPSATEYMLQHVIFVVPASERGAKLGKRKQEAEAMRQRFGGCDSTRQFTKGLIDVTVRDLGRFLEPALPRDWADAVKETRPGAATPVRETDRGIEFIGICSAREVSDDRVAQMMASKDAASGDAKGDGFSAQYLDELRKRAKIVAR